MVEPKEDTLYQKIMAFIFNKNYSADITEFSFDREDILNAVNVLGVETPKNLGDVVYSVRYRTGWPDSVLKQTPAGKIWTILGAGVGKYQCKLFEETNIVPRTAQQKIKILDATPEIIKEHSKLDEQSMLSKVRYNRLIDLFLGITAYSLQNHLRTTVPGVGQIEVDEIYVGVDSRGCQYIVPVQAKGKRDKIGLAQTMQDIEYCSVYYPNLVCKTVSIFYLDANTIAMFELELGNDGIVVVKERHYVLVNKGEIDSTTLLAYKDSTSD